MKNFKFVSLIILTIFSTNLYAYGSSSSSKKACKKPKFTQFTPPHLTAVAAQSEFSFQASMLTNPDSIEVSVKKQPVEVTISKVNNAYTVSGRLPKTLTGTFARVKIDAKGINNCKGSDGWLLKIEE
ncbi:MAG: hypothetical protein HOE45_03125 [Gammaproteobacteria bacterium]|jgi:hypothetical protein|nr:hypothetical protein [Gammaproteobacteria bacterium]MBT4145864.1 hypothetical protein [Gammaproteobacteria bacterium]MBT5221719.1 hypothetical protein [Gammaproteobacteria bacterium]MBT5826421.1 hypothetical protein [Gammaproteobacteria bacterium]MBT5966418.1 hypothetical protein [Gammaproteobacteria bacterium]